MFISLTMYFLSLVWMDGQCVENAKHTDLQDLTTVEFVEGA